MFSVTLLGSIFLSMLYGLHIFVAFLMVVIILMQAAKGGGLSGAFGTGMGSSPLFGAATSSVLVRGTTILAIIFAITCISLAAIQSSRSTFGGKGKKQKEAVATEEGAVSAPEEDEAEGEGQAEGATSPSEEKALSPVEAEAGPLERREPSLPEEKTLSPTEAEGEADSGATAAEAPSPVGEKPLSPVEAGGEEEEPEGTPLPGGEASPADRLPQ